MKKILFAVAIAAAVYLAGALLGKERITSMTDTLRRQGRQVGEAVDSAAETARDKVATAVDRAADATTRTVERAVDTARETVGDIADRLD